MANIDPYIQEIQNAVYGEEVRGSIINALQKVNDDNESYQQLKQDVLDAKDTIDTSVDEYKQSITEGESKKAALEKTISSASTAKQSLDSSINSADSKKKELDTSTNSANTAKQNLDNSVAAVDTAKEKADQAKKDLDNSVNTATQSKTDLDGSISNAEQTKTALDGSVKNSETARENLDTTISNAGSAKTGLQDTIDAAGTSKTELSETIDSADQKKSDLDGSIEQANTAKESLDSTLASVDGSISSANSAKSSLDTSINTAATRKTSLDDSIQTAGTSKTNLDASITNAGQVKEDLQNVINDSNTKKTELSGTISTAEQTKEEIQEIVSSGETLRSDLTSQNSTAAQNIEALSDANFNANEILTGVEDIKAYLGYTDEDIVGIQVDYENKSFQRLAGAYDLTGGEDFNKFEMFGGRKRCNVSDDGTIVAWYGDEDYAEDGSMGQVMVYQPAFYYKVVPLRYDPITDGIGYHLRKANYYVSTKPKTGFKRHPAFYDKNNNEIDYVLLSAYEGCVFDVSAADGAGAYILDDNQVADFTKTTGDKFSSIAGAKPASGKTQNLTRPNVEIMAQNRGTGWHGDLIKPVSANQLLMIIEMGMMNSQTAIANGVVSVSDTPNTENNSIVTGGTSSLGNGTGQAEGGTNGKSSISYRGVENPWGNIWKFVYGVNIHGDGSQKGGIPYICSDFSFAESKNSDNYESAGFTVANANGYISAMGYSEEFDWLFFPSEATGNSSLPVGDYLYITSNLNGYRIALLGGSWNGGGGAGAFYWYLSYGVGGRDRTVGARLVYIPTTTDDSYEVNLNAWRDIMTA